jgi:hypothetical protein
MYQQPRLGAIAVGLFDTKTTKTTKIAKGQRKNRRRPCRI